MPGWLFLRLPGVLARQLSVQVEHNLADPGYSLELKFPDADIPAAALQQIPLVGKFGAQFALGGGCEYALRTGEWQVYAGASPYGRWASRRGERPHSSTEPKFYLGNTEVDFGVYGFADGLATQTEGIHLDRAGIRFTADFKAEILTIYLTDWVPGLQWGRALDWFAQVGADINSIQRVRIYGLLKFDSTLYVVFEPPPVAFGGVELGLGAGLEIAYEPDLKIIKGRVYAGGMVEGTVDWPAGSSPSLKEIKAALSGGIQFTAFGYELMNEKFVLLQYTYPPGGSLRALLGAEQLVWLDGKPWVVVTVSSSGLKPRDRSYGQAGPQRFVAQSGTGAALGAGSRSPLEDFRAMLRTPVPGTAGPESQALATGEAAASAPAQADLPLVQNAYPDSSPALAGRDGELMLVFVADGGGTNPVQFTDIHWSRFDGMNWSAPVPIAPDTRGEFAPQVAFDGNGDAIAVWERVADAGFTNVDLTALAAQLEIVWSRWSRTNGAWSEPVALTANNYLDHAPRLCGPMADGSLLAVWTRNEANLLLGTNAPGHDQVLWCRWSAAGQSWSGPEVLLGDVSFRLSQALAGASNYAAYAWTKDMDGVLTNDFDQEVFQVEYFGGAWGAPKQLTTNSVADKNARLVASPVGGTQAALAPEGFESGGFSAWPWVLGGNAPWTVQSSVVKTGSFAAASGAIGHSQSSSMSVATNCAAGAVSFAYKVSSEGGFDYLRFLVDGQQMGSWSGEAGWATATYPVSAGPHTFEWRYTKDGSVVSGSDKAWVDEIVFPVLRPAPGVYAVWQQETNLVLSRNFSTNITIARPDSATAGFADYALTLGPAGNLVLLWQEMTGQGSDAHYRVYDPASDSWSRDALLFGDAALEQSFAPVWDAAGNLTFAYNKVEMLHTNEPVTLPGGGTLTLTNVPVSGRVDLMVTKRALIKDVALLPGDFTAQGGNFLPGDAVTLSARIENAGNVALSNVVVGFYDGNPTNGGLLLTNVTLAGWLEGAASAVAAALWIVPEPATNHMLYAVVDRANAIAEFNETNNAQSLSVGGTDLAVTLVTSTVETNGALRVIAQVQNRGAPTATNSVLAIRRKGESNAPLASVAVPSLEPGRLAQVALDLPPGTQSEGEVIYLLFADETAVVADADTSNNTTRFAVNLWLDADGDGMPDGWEAAHGLSVTNGADASLDSDGDGMSNLAEYRAGTNPHDATSYLRITSIGVGGTNGVQIAWGSAANRLYAIQRAGELATGIESFTNIAEHVLSTPPENLFFDLAATNRPILFYRVKVE